MKTGRVTEVHRTNYTVAAEDKEYLATVRGSFHEEKDFPKVGDYVELETLVDEKAVITKVFERRSVIKRKSSDTDDEQVIAANVDVIFIVMGLDGDYNLSRLERYLLLAKQSGVEPVVILNKADLLTDPLVVETEVGGVVGDVPVYLVSAITGEGLKQLQDHIKQETTAVLLGSSGAGKSTITNWLLQEDRQKVREIREDDSRGRHTTTSRQLFVLPGGGYLIDTPGMRELGVLEADSEDQEAVFQRIEEYAAQCKFRNCDHDKTVGCAVLAAIEAGELTERELHNYQKLLRERSYLESKGSTTAARHYEQNQKRQRQHQVAVMRDRLRRRLN